MHRESDTTESSTFMQVNKNVGQKAEERERDEAGEKRSERDMKVMFIKVEANPTGSGSDRKAILQRALHRCVLV